MKKLLTILFILLSSFVYAEEKEFISPMSLYHDNFFLAGNSEDQVKLQVSAKYNIFYPSQTGLYLGYSQMSNWICYKDRDTFLTQYMPEVFYNFTSGDNIFNNSIIPFVDYIQVSPINHCSTGVEGENHRGINIGYGQIQMSYGEVYNVGFNLKGWYYYSKSVMNRDIADYKGYYESSVFFKLKSKTVTFLDKEELVFKFGNLSAFDYKNGWFCVEARFRIITSYVQPKFFIQYYRGMNEFMVNYKTKTNSVRVGVVF